MLFSNAIDYLPGQIMFDNIPLKRVHYSKFLGIIIDEDLTWKPHINNVCTIVSRNIGIINKLKLCFPKTTLLTLYYALIYPYLNYGILAWGNACKTLLDRILLLQKKALRIISNTDFRAHTDVLFSSNKLLKIHDIYSLQLGAFMFSLNNDELPLIFNSMFIKNKQYHSYPTRLSGSFHLPKTRTLFANHIFTFTGPKFWNSLPPSLTQIKSSHTFRRRLKKLILEYHT